MLAEQLQIGRILGPHGIRGELSVQLLTDDPTRFDKMKTCLLEGAAGMPATPCRIAGVRHQQATVLLRLAGVDDRDAAEKLKGRHLLVDRKDAVKLPPDSYFVCDLLGCRVQALDGEELGILEDVIVTGSNDVYVVRKPETKDLLLPALKTVVRSVDIAARLVRVVLPDGLRD
jgi:16S rRNA processing protein RimM